jgi:hypothetical protein
VRRCARALAEHTTINHNLEKSTKSRRSEEFQGQSRKVGDRSLRTAAQIWEHFVVRGGLGVTLGLGHGPIKAELIARGVAPEQLVPALLGSLAPFSAMMSELLSLFEGQGIRRSDGSVEIVFDFKARRKPLCFDLLPTLARDLARGSPQQRIMVEIATRLPTL